MQIETFFCRPADTCINGTRPSYKLEVVHITRRTRFLLWGRVQVLSISYPSSSHFILHAAKGSFLNQTTLQSPPQPSLILLDIIPLPCTVVLEPTSGQPQKRHDPVQPADLMATVQLIHSLYIVRNYTSKPSHGSVSNSACAQVCRADSYSNLCTIS